MTAAALAGRRVLDLADESGVYCTKLLADMGADVIKIEPPGGDATRAIPPFLGGRPGADRSFFFLYMNTSKRGVTLDIATPEGRALLLHLAATADLVVETFPPGHLDDLGLGYAALQAANPGLVLTSITGFGQTGPQRDFKSSDLVASALGGAMHVTGEAEDPPVALAGSQAHVVASTCAAASSLIALHHSRVSGEGQRVDISVLETMTAVTHICGVGKWRDDGIIPKRSGTGLFASVPSGAYRCSDGLVYLMVNRPLHWQALAQWIHEVTGNEEVLDPMFAGPSSNRLPYRELLDVYISDMTSQFRVDEVYREGQRRHIAFTPVNTATAVARDAHLAARDFVVETRHPVAGRVRTPGAPYRHAATPWRIRRPAPRVGEHNAEVFGGELGAPRGAAARSRRGRARAAEALAGLRVVEFTAGMAGPWIGRFMAWCGAEVIKVESHQHPSVVRLYVPPRDPERGTQPRCSPWFTDWDAGKRFIALDLSRPAAVELAKRVVARADVVVENHSAGVMDKLGLGYEQLRAVKPDIILFGTSGYGDTGPDRSFVTWGPNIEALSGSSAISGFPQRECTVTQYAYPDALSALHGLVAVMCALENRAKTGEGQLINLAQFEATVAAIGHVMLEPLIDGREPQKLANRSLSKAPHGCYRCRGEDRWCVIAVANDVEWERFRAALGRPRWAEDPRFATLAGRIRNADALDPRVEEWTAGREPYEVMDTLQAAGIAAGVVQNVEDQFERDPQLAARHFFEEIEHLVAGTVVATGIPLGLLGTPGRSGRSGAAIGEDNDHVFGELLGMTPEEIRSYTEAGAIEPAED
jgi:crotonobetainyl-CoA:carnitine CoA-transferase CaiB-like acyl-CoA transferase